MVMMLIKKYLKTRIKNTEMFLQIENQNEHLKEKLIVLQKENKELKNRINYFNESRISYSK